MRSGLPVCTSLRRTVQLSSLVVATGLMDTADGFMVIVSVRYDWIIHCVLFDVQA